MRGATTAAAASLRRRLQRTARRLPMPLARVQSPVWRGRRRRLTELLPEADVATMVSKQPGLLRRDVANSLAPRLRFLEEALMSRQRAAALVSGATDVCPLIVTIHSMPPPHVPATVVHTILECASRS